MSRTELLWRTCLKKAFTASRYGYRKLPQVSLTIFKLFLGTEFGKLPVTGFGAGGRVARRVSARTGATLAPGSLSEAGGLLPWRAYCSFSE
jgi:hypothetical protein